MDNSKRNLTKILGASGIAASIWTKPMVDAVNLPAHAATTSGVDPECLEPTPTQPATNCSVDPGCLGPTLTQPAYYIDWPGGGGAQAEVQFLNSCDTSGPGSTAVVLAVDLVEAKSLLDSVYVGCDDCQPELLLGMEGNCDFYWYPQN